MSDTTPAGQGPQTVSLADEEGVKQILVSTVLGLWGIVNNLTRLRPSHRERYRVTIFGSARARPGTFVYEEVKHFARTLAEMGCDIVTGGGPGLMEAANQGAAEARAPERSQSIGIRVDLPFEQEINPFVDESFEHATFFTRLHHFVLVSDAFIVVPGGIGTVLEATMIWQLLQVRHMHDVSLLLVGRMWADFMAWARTHMLGEQLQLASTEDLALPRCVSNREEAIAALREHHAAWLRRRKQAGP